MIYRHDLAAFALDQHQHPLVDALKTASERPHAAFYAPGHKGGQGIAASMDQLVEAGVFRADRPELPELDNLFAPDGVILTAQTLAAEAFGADRTWFLANGSTCGIEAALLATCGPGDGVILPRNVHQSVISGLILSGAMPIFVSPEYDADWDMAHGVSVDAIATVLHTHAPGFIRAILVVSPTYYGTCSNVEAIAHLAHQHSIPLIVDEAHGPHFGFHPDLPTAALAAGADLVVQSTHKVLSALTQASMLHLNGPSCPAYCPSPQRLSQALQLVQSTSPNYLLLASLDAARHQMATDGHRLMTETIALADNARTRLQAIPGVRVFDPCAYSFGSEGRESGERGVGSASAGNASSRGASSRADRTRLTVDVTGLGLSGFEADELLHTTLGVTAELPTQRHLTFIISLGNTVADIDRLVQGFAHLAQHHAQKAPSPWPAVSPSTAYGAAACSPRDAFFAQKQTVAIAHAVGRISAELICPYPPGIPLIMPGEVITADALQQLQAIVAAGGVVTGCADPTLETMLVVSADSTQNAVL